MSYSWALLSRWSTRDRLAVLVIAVTAAFLVGAVVVLLAVSGQTTAMAGDHGADTAVSLTTTPEAAVEDGTAFPLATVRVDGERRTVVGVPEDAEYDPPDTPAGSPAGETVTLVGERTTISTTLTPATGQTPFPDRWLVTDAATAERLGSERALVFRDAASPVPAEGAPLSGVLAFFLVGTRQMLGVLGVVCAGVAVLVGVVVFSVTRMTVRERRDTFAVLRATGASARRVRLLVAARAGLLTLCGVAIGYAVGLVVPNAAATAAVTLGLPVGLPLQLDGEAAALVTVILAGLVAVGVGAGALAARSVVRGAPLDAGEKSAWTPPGGPEFLSMETVVPTLSTLSVFVAFVLVVAALGGVLGGLSGGGAGGMVVEPGAVHPVDSHVPVAYASEFRRTGAAASPEILLFLAYDGRAVPARGVDFEAYRSVSDARVVAGRAPNATDEAVVGAGLARTLGVAPGDELALGGSTTTTVATVEIVGTFEASGAADDHLLVSLPLARHLEDVPAGAANVVRFREGASASANETVVTLGLSAPRQAATGEDVTARVRVQNVGADRATRTVRATFGEQVRQTRVTLSGGERRTVELTFEARETGDQRVVVDDRTWTVRVLSADTLVLAPLPEQGPTNATLHVGVDTVAEGPVADATVSVGNRTVRTDATGAATLRLPATAGRYTVDVRAGERSATREIAVRDDAPRDPAVRVVTPKETGVYTRPTVDVRVRNPWDRDVERTVSLTGPGLNRTTSVRLSPGESETLTATLARRPPGTYRVGATAGEATAESEYRVVGDERLASAVASSGRASGGVGSGGLVSRAFGNVALVLATLVGLGVLMTVGSTVAAFADAVQARRRDIGIHRAVGATPRQVVRLVLADAARISLPAAVGSLVLAGAALALLSLTGTLTVFGVRLAPSIPLAIAPLLALATFALSVASAGVVAWRYCAVDPAALFGGGG
ncbi:FtsX-like permease family protein [Haloplanus sp. C73]|uniref:FtsX-like permease family protein n=1 Tax=Haloplanus sp. C73 TaxID=3421641 RepID=UPI003EB900D1